MDKKVTKTRKKRYNTCNADKCRKPRARRGLCTEHFAKEYPGKSAPSTGEATPS